MSVILPIDAPHRTDSDPTRRPSLLRLTSRGQGCVRAVLASSSFPDEQSPT
jgi:hypothetical protein